MTLVRSKKNIINFIKRPEYYFRPGSIFKKVFKKVNGVTNHKTPWGNQMEIDVKETIGNSIFSTGIYDLPLSETLWRLTEPGNFVLDIGANIGFVSGLFSHRTGPGGKVWSFEPNPVIINRLKKNISNSKYGNITLYPFALSDSNSEGFLEFPDIFSYNQGVAYVENNGSHSAKAMKIDLRKLDDMIGSDILINVVKIDVEGHELSVFKGAEKLIDNKQITNIVYEDHDPYPSPIAKFLTEKGYTLLRMEKGWFNLSLKDPISAPSTNGWEPTNYLATLDTEAVKKKMTGMFYQCL
ncbi:MAG: FkbM family methyltransferase [Bacteroidota bacterium]